MKGYENALQKMVRLLRELNQELVEHGELEQISVTIRANGDGIIFTNYGAKPIYEFNELDKLMEYLEAGNLKRILMSRG